MFEAKEINGFWYACQDGHPVGTWTVGRMPITREHCKDAARRLNAGESISDLPRYEGQSNIQEIIAQAPWGDTYTREDAENGFVPSGAFDVEEVAE